jgi:hypothetical protein
VERVQDSERRVRRVVRLLRLRRLRLRPRLTLSSVSGKDAGEKRGRDAGEEHTVAIDAAGGLTRFAARLLSCASSFATVSSMYALCARDQSSSQRCVATRPASYSHRRK